MKRIQTITPLSKSKTQPKPALIHLLMRFSDRLGFITDTIEAHSAVIKKRGTVWFGKMGKSLGNDKVQRLNEQVEKKSRTFLYLVQRSAAKGYQVYRGNILQVARSLPVGQTRRIPEYYASNHLEEYIHLWIKLSKLKAIPSSEITGFVVSSSGSPALATLARSMAAVFIVRKKSANDKLTIDKPIQREKADECSSEENERDWDLSD